MNAPVLKTGGLVRVSGVRISPSPHIMEKNEKELFNIPQDKNILNVDAQKELIDYTMKKSIGYSLKIFLVVFPIMIIFVLSILYFVFHFARG